ncbi:MAG TPA: FAD binding domain-containing protein [Actinomycetes bacterium]|nr:FAD binding domain-containing protein [Actinomycetes bacterium]
MKPQSFEYAAPATLAEACDVLASRAEEAKVLAGGQSLVPMMALRLARPELVVDLNGVAGLDELSVGEDGLRLGALVRHRRLERGPVDGPLTSLLARAARHIGHPPIRARGTVCGSLAHADPAAEWCLVGVATDAQVGVVSAGGRRELTVDALLDGPFSTTLEPDEVIADVTFPAWRPGRHGAGLAERSRTAGGFAELAACAVLEVADATVAAAAVAVVGAAGRPVRLPGTEAALVGSPAGPGGSWAGTVARAGALAVTEVPDRGDGGYAAAVLGALVEEALTQAQEEVRRWTSD